MDPLIQPVQVSYCIYLHNPICIASYLSLFIYICIASFLCQGYFIVRLESFRAIPARPSQLINRTRAQVSLWGVSVGPFVDCCRRLPDLCRVGFCCNPTIFPLIFPKLGGVRPFCRIILRHCGSTKLLWNDCVEKANQGGNEGGPAQKTLKLIQTSSKHVSSLHIWVARVLKQNQRPRSLRKPWFNA